MCEVTAEQFPSDTRYPEMMENIRRQSPFMHSVIISFTQELLQNRPTMAHVLEELDKDE